jgi:hypothetical protein
LIENKDMKSTSSEVKSEAMNIKEEQAQMRDKFRRKRRGVAPPRKLSVAVENRKIAARQQKQLESSGKGYASGKEIADVISQLFD